MLREHSGSMSSTWHLWYLASATSRTKALHCSVFVPPIPSNPVIYKNVLESFYKHLFGSIIAVAL